MQEARITSISLKETKNNKGNSKTKRTFKRKIEKTDGQDDVVQKKVNSVSTTKSYIFN